MSEWTIDTLKEHFEGLLAKSDQRTEEHFKHQEIAVTTALANTEKAIGKAELATEKRFDSVNEFRLTLSDQTATFARTDLLNAEVRRLEEKIASTAKDIADTRSRSSALMIALTVLLTVIGVGVGVITLVARN
jgi:hypothetical protein